jgi:hypothetical protein
MLISMLATLRQQAGATLLLLIIAVAAEACVKSNAAVAYAIGNMVDSPKNIIIGANDKKERRKSTRDYVISSRIFFAREGRWSWRRDGGKGERDAPRWLGWFDTKSKFACSSWTPESILSTKKFKHAFRRHPGISWGHRDVISARSSGVRYFATDNRIIGETGDSQISDCYGRGLLNFGVVQSSLHDVQLLARNASIYNYRDNPQECDYKHRQIVGVPPFLVGFLALGAGWFLLWARKIRPEWLRVIFAVLICGIGAILFGWGYSHVDLSTP